MVDLIGDGIIKKKSDMVTDRYSIFNLNSATGVLYITPRSHQYISGHLRLRGKDNGQYPYRYKEVVESQNMEDRYSICWELRIWNGIQSLQSG